MIAFAFLIGLFALARWGARLVRPIIATGDSELTVILTVGFGVFVAGFAHSAGASDAVGALLAGMVVAGTGIGPRVERLLVPLRDVFAAIFFFWFGLTIAPSDMGAIAPAVVVAVLVTLLFNVIAGIVAARIYGYGRQRGRQHRADARQPRRVRADPRRARGRGRARQPGRPLRRVLRARALDPVAAVLGPVLRARRLAAAPALRAAARDRGGRRSEHSEPIIEVGVIRRLGAETLEHPVRREHAVVDLHVRDLGLPRDALVSVIVRGDEAIAPRGSTRIRAGDRLHILVRQGDREARSRRCRSAGAADRWARRRGRAAGCAASSPIFTVRPCDDGAIGGDLDAPERILDQPVVAHLRVRRDRPGALVALEDGRYAITGPLLDRRLAR